jgi:CubicO group peptidase (beta-lactamase class C family)
MIASTPSHRVHLAAHRSRSRPRARILALVGILISAGCQVGDGQMEQGKGELDAPAGVASVSTPDGSASAASLAPTALLDRRDLRAGVGLDSALIAQAVERAGAQSRLHNMIVARHGEVLVERHFRGPPPDRPANVKSVSKSLLSAIVGLAIQEGHLPEVDTPIGSYFSEYLENGQGASDPKGAITLGNLLSMSSGLESTSFGNYGRWVASSDWVGWVLSRPMNFEPGERMVYSTGNTHLVSALLTRAAGESTHRLARRALAEPMGIQLPPWPQDPNGIYFGGNDMLISPRGLLRFGEMYRNGGVLDDRRILPREWVEESWRVRVHSRRDGNGYGLGWWARDAGDHEVRFAWGYGGQFLFIVPELELTVVFTSDPWSAREGGHNRVLHDLVDDFLVPAAVLGNGPAR